MRAQACLVCVARRCDSTMFDLTQLKPYTIAFDLVIGATEELNRAVAVVTTVVTNQYGRARRARHPDQVQKHR